MSAPAFIEIGTIILRLIAEQPSKKTGFTSEHFLSFVDKKKDLPADVKIYLHSYCKIIANDKYSLETRKMALFTLTSQSEAAFETSELAMKSKDLLKSWHEMIDSFEGLLTLSKPVPRESTDYEYVRALADSMFDVSIVPSGLKVVKVCIENKKSALKFLDVFRKHASTKV